MKEDKFFSSFIENVRSKNLEHEGKVYIWGAQNDVKYYDILSRSVGFATRLFVTREDFINEIINASDALMVLILRDRLSLAVRRALAIACAKTNPLYVLRIYSYAAFDKQTERFSIITEYSPLTTADTAAARQSEELTLQALKPAKDLFAETISAPADPLID